MSFIIVFINEVVSYFEFDIFALLGNFISFIVRFIMSFIYIVCNLFGHLLWGERYFTLGGDGSYTRKPFDFKKDRFLLKRNGDVEILEPDPNHPSHNHRHYRRIRIKPRAGEGEISLAELRRREQAARDLGFEYRSGFRSRGNVDHSEFNTSLLQKLKCRVY
jgi:hypothetical protein